MSDTPRTDAAAQEEWGGDMVMVTVEFAQKLERENAALRAELDAMKAATYSHVDGRDLLHELQPNGAHYIDILVRINGQDRRYQGDWLKTLTWARDGHNMGEYADNPKLRALIEQRRKEGPHEVGECSGSIDAAIDAARRKP